MEIHELHQKHEFQVDKSMSYIIPVYLGQRIKNLRVQLVTVPRNTNTTEVSFTPFRNKYLTLKYDFRYNIQG